MPTVSVICGEKMEVPTGGADITRVLRRKKAYKVPVTL
jgi:hypothetical protein